MDEDLTTVGSIDLNAPLPQAQGTEIDRVFARAALATWKAKARNDEA